MVLAGREFAVCWPEFGYDRGFPMAPAARLAPAVFRSNDPNTWRNHLKGQGREAARRLYPSFFSKAIKRSRLRMWCKDGEWMPVIWCPNLTTAMFTHAAFNRVETCLNCQKLFCLDVPRVDDSRSEKYCTVACGQRFRHRIYRKRQLEETKGKSR
jgi:hypothetical protein